MGRSAFPREICKKGDSPTYKKPKEAVRRLTLAIFRKL